MIRLVMTTFTDVEKYVDGPNICVLATVGRRNRPDAPPAWYLHRDGIFVLILGRGTLKHRDIVSNPRVMITLDRREPSRGEHAFAVVMADGVAVLTESVSRELLYDVASRYEGEGGTRSYVQRTDLDALVTIRLRPDKNP